MSFKDLSIKWEYRSSSSDTVNEFLIPVLKEAVTYDRAVGFFSSTALVEIAEGLENFVRNNGKIRIIASPHLSKEDLQAINEGYKDREIVIKNSLLRSLDESLSDPTDLKKLKLLADLIKTEVLDIKIAILEENSTLGMYHEKMGILMDSQQNKIAFSGSMNDSKTAMLLNYESIDVFKSWESDSDRGRINTKAEAFENIWNGTDTKIRTYVFPEVNDKIIEQYGGGPGGDPPVILSEKEKPIGARIPENVKLYDYQLEAIQNWMDNNSVGIFDMATGTGKTFTGLGAISRLSEELSDNLAVIIVCPFQHLVNQWVEDIEKFNIQPIIGYSGSPQRDWRKRLERAVRAQRLYKRKKFFCFICTNKTFTDSKVQNQIQKIKSPILLVVDEAHNFGAKSYKALLNEEIYKYRLALSATLERFRDDEGTEALNSFFGKKCIEYPLERAIEEKKLTRYKYYPVLVYLNDEELEKYIQYTNEMRRHLKKKNGKLVLDSIGELIAIKRSRVVAAASMKLDSLIDIIKPYVDTDFNLVYCGATTVTTTGLEVDSLKDDLDEESNTLEKRQIDAVSEILGNELEMKVAQFTSRESAEERERIKSNFQEGNLQAIIAIKCLDEGFNIPGIRRAFILASTTNPKEYIQRRGRVLRKAEGKDFAEIFDFVTLPRPLNEVLNLDPEQKSGDLSLVDKELKRVAEFARLSSNRFDSQDIIWSICDAYEIDPTEYTEEDF